MDDMCHIGEWIKRYLQEFCSVAIKLIKFFLFVFRIFFFIAITTVIGVGIQYLVKSGIAKENINAYISFFSAVTGIKTVQTPSNWKEHANAEYGLSFKAPPEWIENSDGSVSQFRMPLKPRDGAIYNLIEISSHEGVLYSGYYDQDLFKKVFDLNENERLVLEDTPSYRTVFTQTGSGYTPSNHKYVIFKLTGFASNKNFNYSQAYILKDTKLYIYKLSYEDEPGFRVFKDIVASTTIN